MKKRSNQLGGIFSATIDNKIALTGDSGAFVMLPQEVLKAGLSDYELRLYATLLSHRNNKTGLCNPRHKTLADETGASINTVKRTLERLNRRRIVLWNGDRWDKKAHGGLCRIKARGRDIDEEYERCLAERIRTPEQAREYRLVYLARKPIPGVEEPEPMFFSSRYFTVTNQKARKYCEAFSINDAMLRQYLNDIVKYLDENPRKHRADYRNFIFCWIKNRESGHQEYKTHAQTNNTQKSDISKLLEDLRARRKAEAKRNSTLNAVPNSNPV